MSALPPNLRVAASLAVRPPPQSFGVHANRSVYYSSLVAAAEAA